MSKLIDSLHALRASAILRTMHRMRIGWMFVGLAACGPQVDVPESDASGTSTTTPDPSTTIADTSTTTTASTSVGTSDPPDPTTIDPDTTTLDPETTADSASFIQDPEVSCLCLECDLWLQDCIRGDKCMPWANDGGNAWNAARCSPIDENPGQPGDPCTVEGSGVSGIDSCDISTMCWNVDPETNTGTCVPFCTGSPENPSCEAACDTCMIANEGYLILCLPVCDPAAAMCPEGQACLPFEDSFICTTVGEATVGLGEVCDDATCSDGLRCVGAAELPSCDGASCCTPWCGQGDVDPCPAAIPGTTCLPVDFGEVPGCVDPIGYCALE